MKTRKLSLLLSGLALLTPLVLSLGAAHAHTASPVEGRAVAADLSTLSWHYAGDKKAPKPTPGPQEYADDKKKPKPTPGPQDGGDD